jgi:hypothetical protein
MAVSTFLYYLYENSKTYDIGWWWRLLQNFLWYL